MRTHLKFRNLAAGVAVAVATSSSMVLAQLPSIGGGVPGGVPSIGPVIGPNVGPTIGPGGINVPSVVPNGGSSLPNTVRGAVPNRANNAVNNTRNSVRDQNLGPNMPLTVQGVTGKQIGQDG